MRKTVLIASLLLLSSGAVAPGFAGEIVPVAPQDLSRFAGLSVLGLANANLGVVSQVDTNTGIIGLAGRHGEFAYISTSLLGREGNRLHAPALTTADIKFASDANLARPGATLVSPHVIVIEPPAG